MTEINGWLNIYKPYGYGSTRTVAIVKRMLKPIGAKKVGHGGTLDPLAMGILPICINKATKTVVHTVAYKKVYNFQVTFGEERATDDAEGEIINQSDKIPTLAEIESILPKFTGKIQQTPPNYSAIRVKGNRAYDLARSGKEFKLEPREVEVVWLKCNGFVRDKPNTIEFEVKCGKGFYIRSLGKDIARAVGAFGYITRLERTEVGIFTKEKSVSLEDLETAMKNREVEKLIVPIEEILKSSKQV